jgi:phospholipase/carboxylesterase
MNDARTLQQDAGSGLAFRALGPAAPEALLVLLHGVGGQELDLKDLAAASDPGVLSLLVRGPLTLDPGSFGWYRVGLTPQGPSLDFIQAEAGRLGLAAFLGNLQRETGLGPERTVVAGFSQGGIMSAGLALTRPDLVAGFGLLSGRILPELAPRIAAREDLASLAGFISHGLRDNVLPPSWAERSEAWLTELGVTFQSRRYPAGHELTAEMARDFHAWMEGRLWTRPANAPGFTARNEE